jgi:hypothetical protein
MWTLPKPPPAPLTERELFVRRIAGLIRESVRDHCDGYTDEYGVVDGDVDFMKVAESLIDKFGLSPAQLGTVVNWRRTDGPN